jgi:hypothetical protein
MGGYIMKNIKFRYWNRSSKKMMEVTTLNFPLPKEVEVDVMQYTGLQDVYGNEIYEGDILDLVNQKHRDTNLFPVLVVYDNGSFRTKRPQCSDYNSQNLHDDTIIEYDVKIVGNVYQNYDLLSARRDNQKCKNLNPNRTCMLDNSKCTYIKGEDNGFTCGSYQVIEQNIRKKAILGV